MWAESTFPGCILPWEDEEKSSAGFPLSSFMLILQLLVFTGEDLSGK